MHRHLAALFTLSLFGCTPLQAPPTLIRDAALAGDTVTVTDTVTATDASDLDTAPIDAGAPHDVAADTVHDNGNIFRDTQIVDTPLIDGGEGRDGGSAHPRLTGGFVSSAALRSQRLNGGFSWGSPLNSSRLNGWLR